MCVSFFAEYIYINTKSPYVQLWMKHVPFDYLRKKGFNAIDSIIHRAGNYKDHNIVTTNELNWMDEKSTENESGTIDFLYKLK